MLNWLARFAIRPPGWFYVLLLPLVYLLCAAGGMVVERGIETWQQSHEHLCSARGFCYSCAREER